MVVRGTTRITRKGQITIPAEVRAAAGLVEGDRLEVSYDQATGSIAIDAPASVVRRTAGVFKHAGKPLLVAEEKRISREAAVEEAIRRDLRTRQ